MGHPAWGRDGSAFLDALNFVELTNAAKSKAPPRLADMLREAIRASGLTHYRLAKDCGLRHLIIDRFAAGLDIRLATAGKLAEVLGLSLR